MPDRAGSAWLPETVEILIALLFLYRAELINENRIDIVDDMALIHHAYPTGKIVHDLSQLVALNGQSIQYAHTLRYIHKNRHNGDDPSLIVPYRRS